MGVEVGVEEGREEGRGEEEVGCGEEIRGVRGRQMNEPDTSGTSRDVSGIGYKRVSDTKECRTQCTMG